MSNFRREEIVIENYVIHLSSQVERKAQFEARNGSFATFHWSEGVLGSEFDPGEAVISGLLAPEMITKPRFEGDFRFSPSAIGSAASHVALWRKAIAENRNLTILENDAILAPQYQETIEELTARHPSFDFIQWGWNWDSKFHAQILGGFGLVECHFVQDQIRWNIDNFQKLSTPRILLKLVHSWGINCYTISPKGAQKLIDSALPMTTAIIDRSDVGFKYFPSTLDGVMNRSYLGIEAFACWPPLSIVENDQTRSSIERTT